MKYNTLLNSLQLGARDLYPYGHQIDQLFSYAANSAGSHFSEIEESESSYALELELAGYKKDEVTLEVSQGILTVKAINKARGQIGKSFGLWEDVDSEKVEATLEDGILRIVLNKKERDKPKKIIVK